VIGVIGPKSTMVGQTQARPTLVSCTGQVSFVKVYIVAHDKECGTK